MAFLTHFTLSTPRCVGVCFPRNFPPVGIRAGNRFGFDRSFKCSHSSWKVFNASSDFFHSSLQPSSCKPKRLKNYVLIKIFSKMDGRKKPSPSPTIPPIPYGFIVFTLTPSKTLVECSSSVFSCIVFIRVCEDEKTFKHPMVNRVKINNGKQMMIMNTKLMHTKFDSNLLLLWGRWWRQEFVSFATTLFISSPCMSSYTLFLFEPDFFCWSSMLLKLSPTRSSNVLNLF